MNLKLPASAALLSLSGAAILVITQFSMRSSNLSGEDRAAGEGSNRGLEPGCVRGKLSLDTPEVRLSGLGPTVVFLEPQDSSVSFKTPEKAALIDQKDAKFVPDFLVVCVGQPVEIPNNDKIMHNAFSYSKPNAFDLGVYPKGEAKKVTFKHAGVVDLFCSIHAKMNAVIYVAPSPYHAQVDAAGAFEIRDLPAGKYLLKTWNRKLPGASQPVEVVQGKTVEVPVSIKVGK